MKKETFLAQEFTRYEAEYQAGNPMAFNEAILLAIWNYQPVPEWAVPELENIIRMHAEGRFERKQGVAAPLVIEDRNREAAAFYHKVNWLLRLDDMAWQYFSGNQRRTKAVAFDVVAGIFRDSGKRVGDPHKSQINKDAVKNAYYKVAKAIREGDGAKFGLSK